ncbi:MAG: hypothetical protein GX347_01475 [Epulopiscium sp.]|nr:hypothetical protein [Candidatus Epulonipiscium sp.]
MKLRKLSLLLGLGLFLTTTVYTGNGYTDSLKKIGIDAETFSAMPSEKQQFYSNIEVDSIKSQSKYYKFEETIESQNKDYKFKELMNTRSLNKTDINMIEISEEQFLFETKRHLDSNFVKTFAADSDFTSTSWVEMTTKLASISNSKDYVLTNDVTYIKSNGFLQPINTHITGLGCNSNFSIIKDSEYLRRDYTLYSPDLGIYKPGQYDYIWSADEKSSSGYAFNYDVIETEINNEVFMALRITPNVNTTVLADGYGYYSKYSRSVSPTLSFDVSGASLTIEPNRSLSTAPKTHVQLR